MQKHSSIVSKTFYILKMRQTSKPGLPNSHPNIKVITTPAREYVVEENPNGEIVRGIVTDPIDRRNFWKILRNPEKIVQGALEIFPDSKTSKPTEKHFDVWKKTLKC